MWTLRDVRCENGLLEPFKYIHTLMKHMHPNRNLTPTSAIRI